MNPLKRGNLRRIIDVLIISIIILCMAHCKKNSSGVDNQTTTPTPTQTSNPTGSGKLPQKNVICSIQGQILDSIGQPVAGASVSAGGASVQSDDYGFFRLESISINQNGGLVQAVKSGYFTASRNLFYKEGVTNFVVIQLIPRNIISTIQSDAGGTINVGNATVTLTPKSIVKDADGSPYSGNVRVFAAYLDPSLDNSLQRMPGNLFTISPANAVEGLESYGQLVVELEDGNGAKLQIAKGSEATIGLPASGSIPSISLYYFNPASGYWEQEDSATLTGNVYIAKVKHFSFWSIDAPFPVVDFQAIFVDQNNIPLANKIVEIIQQSNYFSSGYGITDSSGSVSGKIPANQPLKLIVKDDCGGNAYSSSIGPFGTSSNLGKITVSLSNPVTITGRIVDCNMAPVSKGYGIIRVSNSVFRAPTDSTGSFTMNIWNCRGASVGTLSGLDASSGTQSSPFNISLNQSPANAGDIHVCSTYTPSVYFDFTINGQSNNYSLSDYITGQFSADQSYPSQSATYIYGGDDLAMYPNYGLMYLSGPAVPGMHPLTYFEQGPVNAAVRYYPRNTMVTITEFGSVNRYITGSFSDTLLAYNGVGDSIPRLVTCKFHVLRRF